MKNGLSNTEKSLVEPKRIVVTQQVQESKQY